MSHTNYSRRDLLRLASLGFTGTSLSGWLPALAAKAAENEKPRRACILLWMTGGPSQIDTFDPKPEHANGGPYKPIDTSVPGIQIGEHLPKLAEWMEHVAVIRSMSTKEGDHSRAMYVQRTGHTQQGAIHYPTLGSLVSQRLADEQSTLPNFVSVTPFRPLSPGAFSPGFLGPQHAPLVVGGSGAQAAATTNGNGLKVKNIQAAAGVSENTAVARQSLLNSFDKDFAKQKTSAVVESHRAAYRAAVRMIRSPAISAFDLDKEPDKVRDRYGRSQFGQGCLMARRLVEQGVPFVEVSLNGAVGNNTFAWDTHRQNFPSVQRLCETLDPAWSSLLDDLKNRGLLETTQVVWMGEFGRTPRINAQSGRDHYPAAWSVAMSGGGIRGGQVYGKTSNDGMRVTDRPVKTIDLLATICQSVGIDPGEQNLSNVGRPIPLVDPAATPLKEMLL